MDAATKRKQQQQARRTVQVQRRSPRLAVRQDANRAAMLEKYKPRALFKGKGKALSPQKEPAACAVPESAPLATTTAKKRTRSRMPGVHVGSKLAKLPISEQVRPGIAGG